MPELENISETLRALEPLSDRHLIGEGGFGSVYRINFERQTYAVKYVSEKQSFNDEYSALCRLNGASKFLPKFYGYGTYFYNGRLNRALVLEYADKGTLTRYIHNTTNDVAWSYSGRKWLYQMASALHVIHQNGLVFYDFKPDNILMKSRRLNVMLCDFGGCTAIKKAPIVTPVYASPEVLVRNPKYAPSAKHDIWSLGCVMWEMDMRTHLHYKNTSNARLYKALVKKGFRKSLHANAPEDIKKTLDQCWKTDPSERPSAKDIKERFSFFRRQKNRVLQQGCELLPVQV